MKRDEKLGFKSRLVQAKVGYDLRPYLEDTLRAPLPSDLQRLADEAAGYTEWRDVDDVSPRGGAAAAPEDVQPAGRDPVAGEGGTGTDAEDVDGAS